MRKGRTARTSLYPLVQAAPPPLLPPTFFSLSLKEEPAKAGTCARDRRALQQLALNVNVKHSDLTLIIRGRKNKKVIASRHLSLNPRLLCIH